jgi:hypothetical protein
VVISYWHFRTTYRSHFQGSRIQNSCPLKPEIKQGLELSCTAPASLLRQTDRHVWAGKR